MFGLQMLSWGHLNFFFMSALIGKQRHSRGLSVQRETLSIFTFLDSLEIFLRGLGYRNRQN